MAKEENPKPSHQLYKLQITSTWLTRQILCLWNIYKDIDNSHKRKCTSSDSCGHWRQEHAGVGPDSNVSCPHSRSRDQHNVGGHPREMRWTVTPSKGENPDSSDSRKHLLVLCFDLFYRIFWSFFFLLFPFSSPIYCSCQFYWNYVSFWDFYLILSHIFYCCYKPLHLHWAFEALWSFSFFFSIFFLILNICGLLLFFLHLFLSLLFLLLFSPCS